MTATQNRTRISWLPRNVDPADLAWMGRAACRGADPELFFPEGQGASVAGARALCSACPVRSACRRWGLRYELHGVWGGLSEYQREQMRHGEVAP